MMPGLPLKSFFSALFFWLLLSAGLPASADFFSQDDARKLVQADLAQLPAGQIQNSFRRISGIPGRVASFENLPEFLEQIHTHLKTAPLQIRLPDGRVLSVLPQIIGQGTRGIVYATSDAKGDTGAVIKIPKADWISLFRLRQENTRSAQIEAIAAREGISTPRTFFSEALGLFAVRQKVSGVTLTEKLIELNLVRLVRLPTGELKAEAGPRSAWLTTEAQSLIQQVEKLLQVRASHRQLFGDLGPNNYLVENGVFHYVDIGESFEETLKRYDAVKSVAEFMDMAVFEINKYITRGFLPAAASPRVQCSKVHL